jgi:hypothetical protein
MAASMLRALLALCAALLMLFAPPACAAPVIGAGGAQAKSSIGASAGGGAGCVPKGGPYTKDCTGKCCNGGKCVYTSVGGGFFCQ